MIVIPVRRWPRMVGAIALAAVAVVVPTGPVEAGQPPAVIAEPTSALVPEGGSGSFTVRLSHPPSGTVPLGMRVHGTGVWASQPVILIFTPNNWDIPQVYPVFNMPDPDTVDDVIVFTLSVPGYTSDTVTFTQIDRDVTPA